MRPLGPRDQVPHRIPRFDRRQCGFPHRPGRGYRTHGVTSREHHLGVLRNWLSRSHSGLQEIGALVVLYSFYELVRGLPSENVQAAMEHTAKIVELEQDIGVYVEHNVQNAFAAVPLAPTVLGLGYVVLHFLGTALTLFWIHRRHPDRFPIVRTTFVFATALALIGYVLYPAAPPRLADMGFADTVTSSTGLNLSSDLLGALYNPFAAIPSLHFGYALIVGVALATLASNRVVRLAGALYPLAMLLVIVATGNHFLVDAALGGLVVVVAWVAARALVTSPARRAAAPGETATAGLGPPRLALAGGSSAPCREPRAESERAEPGPEPSRLAA